MIRSVLAVVSGYLVMAVGVILSTILAAKFMLGSVAMDGSVSPTSGYLLVNVLCSFAFAVLAGYVAGAVSRRQPILHGAAVGVLMLVVAFLAASGSSGRQPTWYPPLIAIGGAGLAVLGGYLRSVQMGRRRSSVAAA